MLVKLSEQAKDRLTILALTALVLIGLWALGRAHWWIKFGMYG